MFNAVGATFGDGIKAGSAKHLQKILAHGVVGGMASRATGGKFSDGFRSAAAAKAFAPMIDGIGGEYGSDQWAQSGARAQRIAMAAIVGGTTAAMTGGKFANGAVTAAFSRAFNDEATAAKHRTAGQRIADAAASEEDSTDWSALKEKIPEGGSVPIGAGKPKCTMFVHDMMHKAGIPLPLQDQGLSMGFGEANTPYSAEQWANGDVSGFTTVDMAQAGDVAAYAADYTNATGHAGIVGYKNGALGVYQHGSAGRIAWVSFEKFFDGHPQSFQRFIYQ